MSSNVLTQNSSNTKNEQIGVDIHMHREQESSVGNCKKSPESPKKDSYKLNSVSQSMIDGLFEKSVDEQGTNLARSALLKMPFGPERQNLAADTMAAVIKSIGDSDFFNSSSDDEPHT
ncbi:hypothetical protein WUBG_10953 [Wuchereria bancrofti]|nr:hypothetical protein WUBG_10953 [Wuchereria bancrofti]